MTTEPISDERLAEIRAGLDEVPDGPWTVEPGDSVLHVWAGKSRLLTTSTKRFYERHDLADALIAEYVARLDPQTVAALLSRLDKAEAGWQPIETVPKDGTIVDLWARVFGPVSRDNDEARVYVEFRVPAARLAAGGWTNEDGNSLDLEGWDGLVFTHWRPLPPPPSES